MRPRRPLNRFRLQTGTQEAAFAPALERQRTLPSVRAYGGFVRTFADLPPLLKVLGELRRRRKAQQADDDKLDAYLQAILVAMSPAPAQAESTKELMRQEGLDPLTERELQILYLLEKGLTNREIASELVVTPGTVKLHMFIVHVVLPQTNEGDQIVNKGDNETSDEDAHSYQFEGHCDELDCMFYPSCVSFSMSTK